MSETPTREPRRTSGVQSVERAFLLLELMADDHGSSSLSQLAAATGLPLPTIHRLVRSLVDLGYARQEPSRRYALGPGLIRLGEASSRMLAAWAHPHLVRLVESTGESANLAMLDRDQVVYLGHVAPQRSVRMFTEVGRRVDPHCTAVGKAVLADADPRDVEALARRTGLRARTEHTITDPQDLAAALDEVREQGYAVDDQEQELGVRCIAVSVPGPPSGIGISVSGPASRMTDDVLTAVAPLLTQAARHLADDLARGLPR